MTPTNSIRIVNNPQFLSTNLKNGDFVFVRVLKAEHDIKSSSNKALVSFAGTAIEVETEATLNAGDSFKAKLTVDGQKIILSKVFEQNVSKNQLTNQAQLQNAVFLVNEKSEIYNILQNLGIAADDVSFKLIQFAEQMGTNFDFSKIGSIKKLVQKFGKNETLAAEIYMLLKEKGIEPTEENIRHILNLVLGDNGDSGLLKKLNKPANNKKSWVLLPFDYFIGDKKVFGTIMLLKNVKNMVERMNLRFFSDNKSFFFVIHLKNSFNVAKIISCKILFYITPCSDSKKNVSEAKKYFKFIADEVEIHFSKTAMNGFIFNDNEGLQRVVVDA